MEIRNLTTFLKVTELKSFSKAAEALDYSQSAVTVQIQQLERELGVQLFDRIGKNVSITQYGKDFVSYARDVVSAVTRASSFATAGSELTGVVRVGTLDSLMTASFADIMPAFHRRFPHVLANIHGDSVSRLREMLVKNELDLIYTLDDQLLDTQFIKVFEAEEDIVIVTNTENPLCRRQDVKLADLIGQPFVLMNRNNAYRDQFDRELARQGLSVEPFCELESDVLALRLIWKIPNTSPCCPVTRCKRASTRSIWRSSPFRDAKCASTGSSSITRTRCSRRRSRGCWIRSWKPRKSRFDGGFRIQIKKALPRRRQCFFVPYGKPFDRQSSSSAFSRSAASNSSCAPQLGQVSLPSSR